MYPRYKIIPCHFFKFPVRHVNGTPADFINQLQCRNKCCVSQSSSKQPKLNCIGIFEIYRRIPAELLNLVFYHKFRLSWVCRVPVLKDEIFALHNMINFHVFCKFYQLISSPDSTRFVLCTVQSCQKASALRSISGKAASFNVFSGRLYSH